MICTGKEVWAGIVEGACWENDDWHLTKQCRFYECHKEKILETLKASHKFDVA